MSHSRVPHSGVRIHMELLEQEPQADPQCQSELAPTSIPSTGCPI
jgi:hypothetical protein